MWMYVDVVTHNPQPALHTTYIHASPARLQESQTLGVFRSGGPSSTVVGDSESVDTLPVLLWSGSQELFPGNAIAYRQLNRVEWSRVECIRGVHTYGENAGKDEEG